MKRGMSGAVGRAWRTAAMIAVLAVMAGAARAEETPATGDFNREGGFLGANATAFVPAFQDAAGEADFGASAGFGLRGGYRYNEIFATEALYEFAADFGADFGADADNASARYRSQSFTVSGRLIVPWSSFQPWLSGGIGFARGNLRVYGSPELEGSAATSFAGRIAAGIDVPLTGNIGLFVEAAYLLPTRDLGAFQIFGAGAGVKIVF